MNRLLVISMWTLVAVVVAAVVAVMLAGSLETPPTRRWRPCDGAMQRRLLTAEHVRLRADAPDPSQLDATGRARYFRMTPGQRFIQRALIRHDRICAP
jgi:hypothetical protein